MNKKFKSVFGAQELANILGIHVDTLRKRAKSGVVPATRGAGGKWQFFAKQLTQAGIYPFGDGLSKATKNITDVVFVLDGSSSMCGLFDNAKNNLKNQVAELRKAAGGNAVFNVSIITFNDRVKVGLYSQNVLDLHNAEKYYAATGGLTALWDGVDAAIDLCSSRDDGSKAFLISVVTDGQENASHTSKHKLKSKVNHATATDRYTFAAAGPSGIFGQLSHVGFLTGNVTEWAQTSRGIADLGVATLSSLNSYTTSRATGATYSRSFYATPITDDASKFAGRLDTKLDDVNSLIKVERVTNRDPAAIRTFCNKKFGKYEKGNVYYQLTKSEKVQEYKKLIIQDTATGNFYAGWESAKKLLGLPEFTGTVKIKPHNLGEFKVFVQSTSVNRKLTAGTAVVYMP